MDRKVAPTLRGGRGLKQTDWARSLNALQVAPTLRGGRGLKPWTGGDRQRMARVAPTLRGGRGLKRCYSVSDACNPGLDSGRASSGQEPLFPHPT